MLLLQAKLPEVASWEWTELARVLHIWPPGLQSQEWVQASNPGQLQERRTFPSPISPTDHLPACTGRTQFPKAGPSSWWMPSFEVHGHQGLHHQRQDHFGGKLCLSGSAGAFATLPSPPGCWSEHRRSFGTPIVTSRRDLLIFRLALSILRHRIKVSRNGIWQRWFGHGVRHILQGNVENQASNFNLFISRNTGW